MSTGIHPVSTPAWYADRDAWVEIISAKQLDAAIKLRDLTNREVAFLAGLSPTYISLLRTGKRTTLSADAAQGIAKALRVRTDELFLLRAADVPRAM